MRQRAQEHGGEKGPKPRGRRVSRVEAWASRSGAGGRGTRGAWHGVTFPPGAGGRWRGSWELLPGRPWLEDKPEWASTNATERSGWKEAAGPNQSCLPRGPGLPRAKKQGATDEGEAARPLAPLGEPGGGGREPEAQGGRRDRILFTAVGWETRACSQGKPPGDPTGTRVGDGGGRGGGPTGGPERGGHSPPHQLGQRVLKEGRTRH